MIKKNLDKILIAASLILAALAIIMLCAAGISPKADYDNAIGKAMGIENYSMAKITFGYKKTVEGYTAEIFKFSFPNLLTYILIIGGAVCGLLALLGKGGKIVAYASAALLLVGGVLYFCAGKLLNSVNDGLSDYFQIGIGSILGGLFSILAAVAVLVPVFLKK